MEAITTKSEPTHLLRQSETTPRNSTLAAGIREELARVLASETFRGAECLRAFLRYVVEEAISGRAAEIKEYTVGLEVYGRGAAFDPRQDSIVRTEARKLRSRLAAYYESEGRSNPLRIEIPKGGYVPAFLENSAPARTAPAAAEGSGSRTRRAAALSAAIVLLLGSVALFFHYRSTERSRTLDPRSVAVLRFANPGDDEDDEIFIEGLTGQVVDSLARVPGLRIVARSSSLQYRSGSADIRNIGKDLRVGTVVEGIVRRSGGRLLVSAALEDTATGYQLWSASYDRNLSEASTIQREISGEIIHKLGVQLAGKGILTGESSAGSAVNPEAYKDYLEGHYFCDRNTPESIKTAIAYFKRAVAKGPDYAPAYSALASCYAKLPQATATPPSDIVPRIRAAASRALQLNSALGEPHLGLAIAFTYDFDWTNAQREFFDALNLEPGNVAAHHAYSGYLAKMGRLEEALAEHRICLNLDPISPSAADWLARSLYHQRRYDDAIAGFQNALALNVNYGPAHQGLGMAYFAKRMYSQGLQETILARQLMEGDTLTSAQLGYGYSISGHSRRHAAYWLSFQSSMIATSFPPSLSLTFISVLEIAITPSSGSEKRQTSIASCICWRILSTIPYVRILGSRNCSNG